MHRLMDTPPAGLYRGQTLNPKTLQGIKISAWTTNSIGRGSKGKTKPSKWEILKLYFVKYCNNTTLHGFRYLVDPLCSLTQRVLWLLVIIAGILATQGMFVNQFHHYFNKPIFFSYQSQRTLIQNIPFPAVTICSQSQMIPSIFNYSDLILKPKNQLTIKEQHQLDFANNVCIMGSKITGLRKYLNLSFLDDMFQMRSRLCAEEFVMIQWQKVDLVSPCQFLQPTLTGIGHCYTFNMVPFSQYYKPPYSSVASSMCSSCKSIPVTRKPDEEYWFQRQNMTPWHVRETTSVNSQDVSFVLNFRSHDFDDTCNLGEKSFVVAVHSPYEKADIHHDFHVVRTNSLALIGVTPHVNLASLRVQSLSPNRRGCFLQGERLLRFYQFYNQESCETECFTNWTLAECGCVLFHHPRDNSTPVCGVELNSCVEHRGHSNDDCNCLPSCDYVTYTSTLTNVNRRIPFEGSNDLAKVYVMFTKKGVSAKAAETIASKVKIVGHLGGLLSLFLGASFISLLELFYFSSLRPLVVVWNQCKDTGRSVRQQCDEVWQ